MIAANGHRALTFPLLAKVKIKLKLPSTFLHSANKRGSYANWDLLFAICYLPFWHFVCVFPSLAKSVQIAS